MILQALVRQYEDLAERGEIAPPGWGPVKVSYALEIDGDGRLLRAISVKTEQVSGKKTALLPQIMDSLPTPVKRTVGIASNFLWDNAGYLLGVDSKGKPERAARCFAAAKELHEKLLNGVDSPAGRALKAFFENWQPEHAATDPALQDIWKEITDGGNLVFRFNGAYIHRDEAVRAAWQHHYEADGDGPVMTCLVTGRSGPVETIHPAIKGVQGAQSSGASLVSFNAPAFCSYGWEQNLNAPTGKYAAFAYTAALNHLLADREHVFRLGDTTVVCWAQGGEAAYQDVFAGFFDGQSSRYTERELQVKVKMLMSGQAVSFDEAKVDPNTPFYILGLSPNAARLSVRFFLENSFGQFLKNIQAHYDRLEIVRPSYDTLETLPPWRLLGETVNRKMRDKSPAPNLAGDVLRAILNNTPYPTALLNGVEIRIRAEQKITWGRAAIIKAYYLKNPNPNVSKEVLTVELNDQSNHLPYVLGRLFAVLEKIQSAANPNLNATIKDKYFNSACATPATIFPLLTKLSQSHLRKLDGGMKIYYEKMIGDLENRIQETLPARMPLADQGTFHLGYYHQVQKFYEKKNKGGNENV